MFTENYRNMNRFFTTKIADSKAFLSEEDAYHIKTVLRAKIGDKFEICNGIDKEYIAVLSHIDKKSAILDIMEEINVCREPKHKYILCQCIPKCRKLDDIVRHLTELGMNEFYPVISERINVKNVDDYDKTDRLQRIVNEASKQSKRISVPLVHKPVKFENIIRSASGDSMRIIAWEEEHCTSLYEVMTQYENQDDIYIMVGPEGGLSEAEIGLAREYGWKCVTLGNRILRTETAPLALLSAVAYHLRDLE